MGDTKCEICGDGGEQSSCFLKGPPREIYTSKKLKLRKSLFSHTTQRNVRVAHKRGRSLSNKAKVLIANTNVEEQCILALKEFALVLSQPRDESTKEKFNRRI